MHQFAILRVWYEIACKLVKKQKKNDFCEFMLAYRRRHAKMA